MSARDGSVGRPPLLPSEGAPPDAVAGIPGRGAARTMQRFGTIIIVGGGCYGSYYLRQLRRAATAGAVAWDRLLVVDRDRACRVAVDPLGGEPVMAGSPEPEIVIADWAAFFAAYLGAGADAPGGCDSDAIVPSPLMPHLMYDWILDRARRRWPDRAVGRKPLDASPAVPWTRAGEDGTRYVSFAEWMCPINCIEPPRCPHTRGPRDWSMPPTVQSFVEQSSEAGRPLHGPCVLHCTHRAYGVGMIDTRDVLAADRLVAEAGTRGAADVLIGTVSHCHGALGVLSVGPGVP